MEIGLQKRHRNLAARLIVGVEDVDSLVLMDYYELLDSLEPILRERLIGSIINMQRKVD